MRRGTPPRTHEMPHRRMTRRQRLAARPRPESPPPPQDPGSAAALCNYGLLLQTVKPDLPRARDLYARALKANPSDPDARGATRMGGE